MSEAKPAMSDTQPATAADVERLIKKRRYKQALALAEKLRPRLRKGQKRDGLDKFRGLAMARLGHREQAQEILQGLYDRERLSDPDTVGILARTWMDCYDRTGSRQQLETSRDLYRAAYESASTPNDRFFLGINVAAKSTLLEDDKTAKQFCGLVEQALDATPETDRDYWHGATVGEVKLLRKDFEGAAEAYRDAVNRFPDEIGSHGSTWLQAQRLIRALTMGGDRETAREAQNQIWEAFGHLSDGAPAAAVSKPGFRRLKAYAFDPSLARSMETAVMNEVVLKIPWEADAENPDRPLPAGPIGEYLEVIDFDPASGCFYDPIELDDRHLLATDGMTPSEGDPKFHQQMVYAVAMNVIDHFERALGRRALWATRLVRDEEGKVVDDEYVRRLRIYPHALREANAYYSPDKKALLFGYFPAQTDDPKILPGGIIFSCLSHDVVAHEVTHALLDGLHPRFVEASNGDVLAFHEAFADIVALFQHFSHAEVLRHEIAQSRGDLGSGTLLGQLAQQFGRAIGNYGALRDAIGEIDPETKEWRPKVPDAKDLEETEEPHARGAILVAAVFDAFLAIYNRRISDLLRIATQGSGILEPGAIHPTLVDRLAAEAAKTATHLLHICIRALDYCPPVDMTFGDYLRAMITADVDMVPNDRLDYRLAIIEAFQRRGIYPSDVRNMSVESLVWRPPRGDGIDLAPLFDDEWPGPKLSPEWRPRKNRYKLWKKMNRNADAVWWWLTNHCPPDYADKIGLALSVDAPGSFYRKQGVPTVEVHSVRVARRTTPEGDLVTDLVVEILQCRRGYLDAEEQDEIDARNDVPDEYDGDFKFSGGCTLLIDPNTYRVRYAITKHILSDGRLRRQRAFRGGDNPALRATYFGDPERDPGLREPFAMLHQPV
ncbi:MAG: tetratricopeptide repeat-containing protein [Thermoanaerobaculia bacterium]